MKPHIAIIAIGRNEALRLDETLKRASSIQGCVLVYVDSKSTDSSLEISKRYTEHVVSLADRDRTSAAAARNAGAAYALKLKPEPQFLQFIDADCILDSSWVDSAVAHLEKNSNRGAICGYCNEAYPERSIFNQLCAWEWDRALGLIPTCGGNALVRATAYRDAGPFNEHLSAGEEADFYGRMQECGWSIERIARPMVLHDANILTFSAWWKRGLRGGMAVYLGLLYYKGNVRTSNKKQAYRITFWALPALIALIALPYDARASIGVALPYPLLYAKMFFRKRRLQGTIKQSHQFALFTLLEKVPRLIGFLGAWRKTDEKEGGQLIEYK